MAFDFNKLKKRFSRSKNGEASAEVKEVIVDTKPVKQSALSKKLAPVKQGLADIKTALDEGNIKLFLKQMAVILIACWGAWQLIGKMSSKKAVIKDHMSAIALQQTHQDDYLENKERLLHLEPLFPDTDKKNEWLIKTLMGAFGTHDIQADINGNAVESAASNYTIMSQEVTFRESFANLGRFMADIENGGDFLRVSQLNITKLTDANSLGKNSINLRFNTVFPKEKYGKRLFKDYDQQIKKIEEESAASSAKEENRGEGAAAPEAEKAATDSAPVTAVGGKANAS